MSRHVQTDTPHQSQNSSRGLKPVLSQKTDREREREVGVVRMLEVMELDPGLAVYVVCLIYLVIGYISGDIVLGIGALIGLFVLKLWTL